MRGRGDEGERCEPTLILVGTAIGVDQFMSIDATSLLLKIQSVQSAHCMYKNEF